MEKSDSENAIVQTVFLLSAIVRRIKAKRLDKDRNERLNKNEPEKRAESIMVTTARLAPDAK